MIRIIFWFLVGYIILRVAMFWRKISRTTASARPETPPALSGTMVKDEICQTYLPKEKALREIIDGEERFFCSPECRRKCLEERSGGR